MTVPILPRRAGLLAAAALAAAGARADQTRLVAPTAAEMQRADADGLAITSLGRVFPGPRVVALPGRASAASTSQAFAATASASGDVYLATGPEGEVIRIAPDGARSVVFHADEPLVTALAPLPSGDLLAATAPGGRIYLVHPDGKSSVWCETKERYVWDLLSRGDGGVFAATGDQGRVLKIDRNGNVSVFFDSDEPHIVSLAAAGSGLWAGAAGTGVVYRIDPDGHAAVVYDDELPEAKALLPMPGGDLVVAFDAPPASEKKPPALRLRLPGASGGRDTVADLDSRQATAVQGIIEGLAPPEPDEGAPLRGKLVRITPSGTAVELWRSRDEAPFALALDRGNLPLFATGEPARLWRVEGPNEIALLATLREGQATAFAASGKGTVLTTSNPVSAYRIDADAARSGTIVARPSDAGSQARWGSVRWRGAGTTGIAVETRTGNCEDPDATWSAWTPITGDGSGGAVTSPDGRYLQWRAKMSATTADGPSLSAMTVSYATRNRGPSIRDLRIDPPGGAVSGKATLRWTVSDPDGDGVSVEIQARRSADAEWKLAARSDPPAAKSDPTLGVDGSSKDGRVSWDTANWDEGTYDVQAVASDQGTNPPGEGLEAKSQLAGTVTIDRTPPTITAKRKGGVIEVEVEDELSGVVRLEVLAGDRVVFSPRCEDGVCDGRRETFRIPADRVASGGPFSLRATDAAGNPAVAQVPEP